MKNKNHWNCLDDLKHQTRRWKIDDLRRKVVGLQLLHRELLHRVLESELGIDEFDVDWTSGWSNCDYSFLDSLLVLADVAEFDADHNNCYQRSHLH